MKRLFDILVSVIFIISFCWLFILIAIIVRAVLGKPVFFSQQRSGKDGKPFVLHKFRTMKISEADNGTLVSDENRMTKLITTINMPINPKSEGESILAKIAKMIKHPSYKHYKDIHLTTHRECAFNNISDYSENCLINF